MLKKLTYEEKREKYMATRISCAHISLKKVEDLRWWINAIDLNPSLKKDCIDSLDTIRDTIKYTLGVRNNRYPNKQLLPF